MAVAGGVPVEDEQTVPLLGRLLLQMLPAPGTPGAPLVPSRLRRLAARAAAGESPRLTVGRLAAGLRPFGPESPNAAIRALFERWRGDARRAAGPVISTIDISTDVSTIDQDTSFADTPVFASPVRFLPTSRSGRRSALAALVGTLLMLIGAGATYWLNADAGLPPLPVSPSILIKEPPPPRDVWELLPDPSELAVQSGAAQSPLPVQGTAGATASAAPARPEKDRSPRSH